MINGNCWVACFDLLGFKEKILDFEKSFKCGNLDIFEKNFYGELVEAQKGQQKFLPDTIHIAWFSDTFIFFTRNDSKESFTYISGAARNFCQFALSKSWPLRGGIGFGQLYADNAKNILLGSGLIDAYLYAEKQNWIGLVLTPKAEARFCELGGDLKKRPVMFKQYDVPLKQGSSDSSTPGSQGDTERLFVVRIQELQNVERWITTMQSKAKCKDPQKYAGRYKVMYDNTRRFFESSRGREE